MSILETMLRADERVVKQAKISKKALLVTWASIPCVFLAFFLVVYLPSFISMYVKGEIREFLAEAVQLETENASAFGFVWSELFSFIPDFLLGFFGFMIGLLVAAWLCWALYMTVRHFRYALAFTAYDLVGVAGKQTLRVPLRKINNIHLERSLWGKIFGYATITVVSSKGSISVKNVAHAKDFARDLAKVSLENEDCFLNL